MVVRSDGYIQKVLWVAAPTYEGPVLIRGSRLDGPGTLRLGTGDVATEPELQLMDTQVSSLGELPGWREWPSETSTSTLGCYAYQIDGVGFTTILVFEAAAG